MDMQDQSIHQLFEAQVARTPEAVAVVCLSTVPGNAQKEQLTYSELNRRANQLARHLRALGVGSETLVGICVERSLEMMVGLLGTLKAGGAYVPLDPAYPRERLAFMLDDTQVPVLLTQQWLVGALPRHGAHLVCIDTDWEAIAQERTDNFASGVAADNLAYVIYTSGSTGKPKGILGLHRGAINRFEWMWQTYPFEAGEVCCQKTSLSFVDSVWEIFGALLQGTPTVVIPDEMSRDPRQLVQALADHHITRIVLVPSLLRAILDTYTDLQHRLPRLKYWVSSGEALTADLFQRFRECLPESILLNFYGSSEVSADATWYDTSESESLSCVPIGRPIANMRAYILDSHCVFRLQPVSVGEMGELYLGGVGLARGYLNQPGLTAEKFVPDPLSNEPGARIYKTGDLSRYLPDGNIEFLGRVDHQVKIRGFRIELGEIEAALGRHPAVRDAVTLAREDVPGEKRLVAYVVPNQGQVPTISELRRSLKERLPDQMVPSAFVILEALPLTPNGKIDRSALPAPVSARPQLDESYVGPRTALERLLVDIWQDVLAVENVGIYDDFFELGGDSIKGAILINKIQEQLQEIVHIVALFDAPTIAELADYLAEHYPSTVARMLGLEADQIATAPSEKVSAAKVTQFRQLISPLPLLDKHRTARAKNPPAIFILSPPRSGSTLLRVVLGGHPRLFAPPELEMLSFNTLEERKAALSGRYSFFLEGAIRAIVQIKGCSVEQAQHVMQEYEDQHLPAQQFYHLMQQWIKDKTLVEKSTTYALNLEILERAEIYFENPLYIHLLRHPYAMIHSFERVRLDQIFFRYEHPFSRRELAELIWLVSHQNILEFLKHVPKDRQHRIKFEALVKQPRSTVEGICQFLNLDFDPEMLQPYKGKKQRMTDGLYPVSRMIGDPTFHEYKGIEAGIADNWKKDYTVDFLGDLSWQVAESLGYERPQPEQRSSRMSSISRVSRGSANQLLAQLDQLSDEEVDSLLSKMLA